MPASLATALTLLLAALPLAAAWPVARAPAARLSPALRRAGHVLWSAAFLALLAAPFARPAAAGTWLAFDPLSALVAPFVLLVSAVVQGFALRYLQGDPHARSFHLGLCVAAALVVALVGAQDAVVLALAWVGSGLALVRLLRHERGWAEAQESADLARRAFALGDAALVLGLGLLAWQAGSTGLAAIAAAPGQGWTTAAAGLLLVLAACSRSAIWPFHRWLLASLNTPTPVSALLHAGLVNAGGVLLARLSPIVLPIPGAVELAFALGGATALAGTAAMLVQPDVKRQLAASTMGQMGFMTLQCGLGLPAAAVFHLLAHGLFKATLFLGAGGVVERRRAAEPPPEAAGLPKGATILGGAALGVAAAGLFFLASGKGPDLAQGTLLPYAFVLVAAALAGADLIRRWTGDALGSGLALLAAAAVTVLYGLGLRLAGAFLAPVVASDPTALPVALQVAALAALALTVGVAVAARRAPAAGPVAGLRDALYVALLNAGHRGLERTITFRSPGVA